jgi:hypothetical protein
MHVLTLKYDSYRNTKVAGSADGHLYRDFTLALLYYKKHRTLETVLTKISFIFIFKNPHQIDGNKMTVGGFVSSLYFF